MKVTYDGIVFDSELEVEYYKLLSERTDLDDFLYQNQYKKQPIQINLGRRKTYTPDFVLIDYEKGVITIVELKGYAKWTANEDNNIMDFMKNKVMYDQPFLIDWLKSIGVATYDCKVEYQRLKHLKGIGFVDYDYKNPNTIANQRKKKIQDLTLELKECKEKLKDYERYFSYLFKAKLTKPQREWKKAFEDKMLVDWYKEKNND